MIVTFVILTLVMIAADLTTKFLIPGVLNPGISWGFGAQLPWLWYVVVALSLTVVAIAIVWFLKTEHKTWVLTIGLALFVGGVLGNCIDRLVSGGCVHDFIDFVIFKNNLADIAIVIGAALVGVQVAFR